MAKKLGFQAKLADEVCNYLSFEIDIHLIKIGSRSNPQII
jgi:hypothetical protein